MELPQIDDPKLAQELVEWYMSFLEGFNTLSTVDFVRTFYSREAQISGPYGWALSRGIAKFFDSLKTYGVKTIKIRHFYDMGKHSDTVAYMGIMIDSLDFEGEILEEMKTNLVVIKEEDYWRVSRETMSYRYPLRHTPLSRAIHRESPGLQTRHFRCCFCNRALGEDCDLPAPAAQPPIREKLKRWFRPPQKNPEKELADNWYAYVECPKREFWMTKIEQRKKEAAEESRRRAMEKSTY